jgi:hypothetical protein
MSNKRSRNKRIKKVKRTIRKHKSKRGLTKKNKSKKNIVDVQLSDNISKGTKATEGFIEYHYQNYSNILDFLIRIKNSDLCFFKSRNNFISLDVDNMNDGIIVSDIYKFKKDLDNCLKNKNRFVPIILNLITNDGNHANILLIDKNTKIIELYEPHGSRTSSSELGGLRGAYVKKVKELKKFFNYLVRYDVKNIVDYQRGTEFQMKNDPVRHSGFCVTWSILFVHYRILNPNISLNYLMKYLAKKITSRKILQYAKFIEETLKK